MSVKDDIAALLEKNRGDFVSGQELADKLGCSRGAVWKAVRTLQQQGFNITAVTNKGYCLETDSDVLSEQGVRKHLPKEFADTPLDVFDCVGSTNTIVKQKAAEGAPEGTVVIAQQQTGGKGRLGRSFFSPKDSGLYLSILLRPKLEVSRAVRITTCAALAVCDAIESATGEKPDIKWVNDVYLRGRKVCGILTEASVSMENGGLDYAVLGIGINVTRMEFPPELADIATSIENECGETVSRSRLIAEISNQLEALYGQLTTGEFMAESRARSNVIGRDVTVIRGGERFDAHAVDIDDAGRLVIRTAEGVSRVGSGEISLKLK